MLPRKIAGRYAEALFDLAQQQGKIAEWGQELASMAQVITDSPELVEVLTHPEIPLTQKQGLVSRVFGDKVSSEILAILYMLIKRGHDPDMQTIHAIYQERWNAMRRVMPVSVTSAVPLNESQTQSLAKVLANRTGATVQLHLSVDPELIAGLVVTMGDRVIDVSARTTLEQLRASMMGA